MKEGCDAAALLEFLDELSAECDEGIEAAAIDMGLAYIAIVQFRRGHDSPPTSEFYCPLS